MKRYSSFFLILFTTLFLIVTEWYNHQWQLNIFKTSGFLSEIGIIQKKQHSKTILKKYNNEIVKPLIASEAEKDTLLIYDFETKDFLNMSKFYSAIKAKKKKIRVAWFGDSMIEGDLVTQDIRKLFQQWLGKSGIGYMPFTSLTAGFRTSIIHAFSPEWNTFNFAEHKNTLTDFSISGYTFTLDKGKEASCNFSLKDNQTNTIRLFAGNVKGMLNINTNKNDTALFLNNESGFMEIPFRLSNVVKNVKIDFKADSNSTFYGVSFESDSGFVLDNFSFRGNSGLALTKVKPKMYSNFNQCMEYDLVVLQYGLNVLSEKQDDYSWYEKGFNKTVSYIRKNFPQAAILIVSVSDKSYRTEEGLFETIPAIENLLNAQHQAAMNNHVAFLNLYLAMGGKNTMVKWVESEKPMANKDYTHLNFRGSEAMGKIIFNQLKAKYFQWEKAQVSF